MSNEEFVARSAKFESATADREAGQSQDRPEQREGREAAKGARVQQPKARACSSQGRARTLSTGWMMPCSICLLFSLRSQTEAAARCPCVEAAYLYMCTHVYMCTCVHG